MAEETPVDTEFTEPEGTVTLVSPSGAEYRTHNAVEINNLVYGQGYKFKSDEPDSVDAKAELSSWGGTSPVRTDDSPDTAADGAAGAETAAPAAPAPSPSTGSKAVAKPAAKAASTPLSTT